MGLFDSWQFEPSTYAGGLLGQLANMTQLAQAPAASQAGTSIFPQPTPDYGQTTNVVGSLGQMAVPTFGQADQAALPQNAQPAQYQPPQEPGIGDRLLAGLQGFGEGGRSGGLIGAFTGGARGLSEGSAPQNQTVKALVAKGLDPAIAAQIARDPGALRAVLPTLLGNTGQTDDIKEYTFAKREDPSLTFEKFMARKRSVTGEHGLNVIYGTDDKGNIVALQPSKSGGLVQAQLPAGVKLSSGVDKLDLGTQWGIIDKRTGNIVGYQAKDLKGAAKAREVGEAQGQAAAKIPAALIDAASTSKKIDELLATKELDSIVGGFDQFRPSWTLGESGADALARLEQLQGGAFLQAFNTLKGGGAITEAEGRKAEQAIARMQRSQSEDVFRIALQDFRDAINDGIKKLQASAGEDGTYPAAVAKSPSASLKSKYGLD